MTSLFNRVHIHKLLDYNITLKAIQEQRLSVNNLISKNAKEGDILMVLSQDEKNCCHYLFGEINSVNDDILHFTPLLSLKPCYTNYYDQKYIVNFYENGKCTIIYVKVLLNIRDYIIKMIKDIEDKDISNNLVSIIFDEYNNDKLNIYYNNSYDVITAKIIYMFMFRLYEWCNISIQSPVTANHKRVRTPINRIELIQAYKSFTSRYSECYKELYESEHDCKLRNKIHFYDWNGDNIQFMIADKYEMTYI
jgi:hypothetical protein